MVGCEVAFDLSKVPVAPHVKNIASSHKALSAKVKKVESKVSKLGQLESYLKELAHRTNVSKKHVKEQYDDRLTQLERELSGARAKIEQLADLPVRVARAHQQKTAAEVQSLREHIQRTAKQVATQASQAKSKQIEDLQKSHFELKEYVKQLAEKSYGFAPHAELRKLATEHETHKNAIEKTFEDFEAELAALTAGQKIFHDSVSTVSQKLEDFQKDHKHWAEAIDHFLKMQSEVKENLKTFSAHQHELLNSIKTHSTTQGKHASRLVKFEKELARVKSLIPKTELAEMTKAHQQYIEFVDARLKEHEQKQEHIDLVFRESLQKMDEFNNKFSAIRDNVTTFSTQLQAWQGRFTAVDQVAAQAGQINGQLSQIGSYLQAMSNRLSRVETQASNTNRTTVIQ